MCYFCTSAAPQCPAHGTVPIQAVSHLRTGRVCVVGWGGNGFEPGTAALQPGALALSKLTSEKMQIHVYLDARTEKDSLKKYRLEHAINM